MSKNDKSQSNSFPWKEFLAFFGVVIAAYFGYLGFRSQTEIPIQATQTAEKKETTVIPEITYTPEPTLIQTPTSISSLATLLNHYNSYGYEYIWTNTDNTIGSAKIIEVQIDGNKIIMKYDYKNGVLTGVLTGYVLSGTWSQENSNGNFELTFSSDFSTATGWWDDAKDSEPKFKNQFGIR